MLLIVGEGSYRFECVEGWGMDVPPDWTMGTASGVSIDSNENIYLIKRTHPNIIVYSRDGKVLDAFGDEQFTNAHGIFIDRMHDDTMWTVDVDGHAVYRWNKKHKVDMVLGNRGVPSDTGCTTKTYETIKHVAGPFNRPTNLRIAPNGDIWVADGYCNARVHVFNPDGTLRFSFGDIGDGPGQFKIVHGIELHSYKGQDACFICDRQNHRVQIFDMEGNYITEWNGFIRPAELVFKDDIAYVAECKKCGTYGYEPARVTLCDINGTIVARLGGYDGFDGVGGHRSSHGICIDSEGSFYLADTGTKGPTGYAAIKKYRRI